jgi:SAM-dependent methyltransferase
MAERPDWQRLQDESHGGEHEYKSPHLRPGEPRNMIVGRLRQLIDAHAAAGPCTLLDMGAGHGSYTAEVLTAGAARVVCTEMSQGAANRLREMFDGDSRVTVVYDPDGELVYQLDPVDVVCMISLLHRIPDYATTLGRLAEVVAPGGSLITFQDPDYYPRRKPLARVTNRVSYLIYRVSRGDFLEGAKSVLRRRTGRMDETNPRDMVEYHVVRKGVDERAVVDALAPAFESVELVPYWSDHGRTMQKILGRTRMANQFGIIATRRR